MRMSPIATDSPNGPSGMAVLMSLRLTASDPMLENGLRRRMVLMAEIGRLQHEAEAFEHDTSAAGGEHASPDHPQRLAEARMMVRAVANCAYLLAGGRRRLEAAALADLQATVAEA